MTRCLLPFSLALLAGCSTVATRSAPPRDPARLEGEAAVGLFPSDAGVLGDEDIVRILDARWTPAEDVRIALLPLNYQSVFAHYDWGWNPTGSMGAGLQTAFAAVQELGEIPGVYDVSYLPDFLLPSAKSVPLVREAAARYQADWILIYSTRVSSHPERRLFQRDEVHGLCLVECALLDTRSGLIPFTARSTQEIHVRERKGEETFALLLRAEQEAIDAAMLENAKALKSFLEGMP